MGEASFIAPAVPAYRRLVLGAVLFASLFGTACASTTGSAPRAQNHVGLVQDAGSAIGHTVGRLPSVESASGATTAMDAGRGRAVRELTVVAHEDDDLLFVNPDVLNAIRAGHEVRTIFLTAGNSSEGDAYWRAREDGVRAAYAAMAGVANAWQESLDPVPTGKAVERFTLAEAPLVSVVFMRLTDGDCDGSGFSAPPDDALRPPNKSLLGLWNDTTGGYALPVVGTWANAASPKVRYTRSDLSKVLGKLVSDFAPTRMHIQNPSVSQFGCRGFGDDHSDHVAGARFAFEAHLAYAGPHELVSHRCYDSATEAPNLSMDPGGEMAAKDLVFCIYARHDSHVKNCRAYGNDGLPYSSVHYASTQIPHATGWIGGLADKCLGVPRTNEVEGAPLELVECADVPEQRWSIGENAIELFGTGECVALADATGATGTGIRLEACNGEPTERWTLTSDGQLRGLRAKCMEVRGADSTNGTPVELSDCAQALGPDGGNLHVPVAEQDWTVRFGTVHAWTAVNGPFSDVDADGSYSSSAAYYGSLRLGDVDGDGRADLCGRRSDGVYCALNDGAGSFGDPSRFTDQFSDELGWNVESRGMTLMLGDVDGDGRADVCGRDTDAIRCATSRLSVPPLYLGSDGHPWTASFSDANGWGAGAEYYGSLRLADADGDGYADVCGRGPKGIVCAVNDRNGGFRDAVTWLGTEFLDAHGWSQEKYGMTIEFGDINGDGRVDVCGRGTHAVFCAVGNERHDGFEHPRVWSMRTDFSDTDGWGVGRARYGTIRLADVNGDGYADLCGRSSTGIVCGFSNGLAFDRAHRVLPQDFTDDGWAPAPYGMTPMFGDLDADGAADICGRGPATVSCAGAP